ncbi:hypothetical protein C4J92_1421 [Pseudomonas sp. R3-18-08]|nr:hypothetical protein C4J92_1421 [Pseudomonas sp. R3-18-08]
MHKKPAPESRFFLADVQLPITLAFYKEFERKKRSLPIP